MVNIIQHALDAVAAVSEPRVEIIADKEQDQVRIVFRDNGPGIPEVDLLRVFDPFYTTKPVGQGTGLELSISYGIVKDHGGSIEVANDPRGGACFTVRLPIDGGGRHP